MGVDIARVDGCGHRALLAGADVGLRDSGACARTELWCAIAYLRIQRFRVRSFGPSRNDGGEGHIRVRRQIRQRRLIQFSNNPGYTPALPRRNQRPGFAKPCPSGDRGRREDRVPATAPTAPAQRRLRERALTTGERGNHSGLPCAVVLRLIGALPGEPSRLPPSSPRCAGHRRQLSAGPRGARTTRLRRTRACRSSNGISASTTFQSASVTIAIRPSIPDWNKTGT